MAARPVFILEARVGVSKGYRAYALDQLSVLGPVQAKSMFGGVGLYYQGVFFALMADDTLYFKVDDSSRPDFEQAEARPFRPYGGDSYSRGYYELPADVLEDRAKLKEWALTAIAVARRSARAKRKRPRTS